LHSHSHHRASTNVSTRHNSGVTPSEPKVVAGVANSKRRCTKLLVDPRRHRHHHTNASHVHILLVSRSCKQSQANICGQWSGSPTKGGGGGRQLTIIKHKISSGPRLAPATLLLWLWTHRKMCGVAAWGRIIIGRTKKNPS
jgi:hypothetical protein